MDWYIPTFWGDIKLSAKGEKTLVQPTEITVQEKTALKDLLLKQTHLSEAKVEEFLAGGYRNNGGLEIDLPLIKVQRMLAKKLAAGRQTLSAVRFANGTMEEVKDIIPAEAKAAVTVKEPTKGCPLPSFQLADIRATRVLRRFLDDDQIADFERHNRFVSIGRETGHRYLLTSRQHEAYRTGVGLRDLDEDGAVYCVHDWDVPAPEELLALHVYLGVAGGESYLRGLTEHA